MDKNHTEKYQFCIFRCKMRGILYGPQVIFLETVAKSCILQPSLSSFKFHGQKNKKREILFGISR